MHPYLSSTVFQRVLIAATAIIVVAWFFTVPEMLAPSTFAAVCGLLAAFAWVFKTTYVNAQPASSLAQSLHDDAVSLTRAPKPR